MSVVLVEWYQLVAVLSRLSLSESQPELVSFLSNKLFLWVIAFLVFNHVTSDSHQVNG